MVASLPIVADHAPLSRRAAAVGSVACLALACMAAGLGLAFPSGIGSRSGHGAGVAPILVTPARSIGPAPAKATSNPVITVSPTAVVAHTAPTSTVSTTATVPAPTTATTLPPDVVGQVNQTVSDVLGNLIPQNGGSH